MGAATGSLGFPKTITQTTTQTQTQTQTVVSQPWLPAKWDYTADVVIAGGGSVGLPAAIEAYDAGATNILVIEANTWLGGQGRRCGGGLMQANSVVQKKFGIVDSNDDMYNYLVAIGQGYADPALLRSFANNDNVDWVIQKLGGQPVSQWDFSKDSTGKAIPIVPDNTPDAQIPLSAGPGLDYSGTPVYFQKYGFKPVMRCAWFTGNPDDAAFTVAHKGMAEPAGGPTTANGGTGVFKTLSDAIAARKGITTMTSTTLKGLVATPSKEVLGITAVGSDGKTIYIRANKGVVLGTGGWSANQKMVQDYLLILPSDFKAGTNPSSSAIEVEEDGAGILAAQAIGADTTEMGAGGGATKINGGTAASLGIGGLRINTNAQVIDMNGNPIPRLYAGGRTTGGVEYLQYPNCGFDFGSAMWFGRVAGKGVAALAPWT